MVYDTWLGIQSAGRPFMNTREIVRVIVGSLCVYVVMAACSASNSGPGRSTDLSSYGGTSNTNGGASNNIKDSSIMDAIASPVPDAAAQAATSGTRLKASTTAEKIGVIGVCAWRPTRLRCRHVDATRDTGGSVATSGPGRERSRVERSRMNRRSVVQAARWNASARRWLLGEGGKARDFSATMKA